MAEGQHCRLAAKHTFTTRRRYWCNGPK